MKPVNPVEIDDYGVKFRKIIITDEDCDILRELATWGEQNYKDGGDEQKLDKIINLKQEFIKYWEDFRDN